MKPLDMVALHTRIGAAVDAIEQTALDAAGSPSAAIALLAAAIQALSARLTPGQELLPPVQAVVDGIAHASEVAVAWNRRDAKGVVLS